MPAPFGWNPADFWIPFLTLGGTVLFMAVSIPMSVRNWHRVDSSERERVAAVLRDLAATAGGEFIGPRQVKRIDEDGDEFGPALDYGTASVVSSGLVVEAGVEVMGARYGKSLRLRVAVPPGRAWAVDRLETRGLSRDARAAVLDLLRHARDAELGAADLTVWALTPRWMRRSTARVYAITDAAALLPHILRAAAAARLLLRD